MPENDYHELVTRVIDENRYLTISTVNGGEPWIAPVEYIHDDTGSFYFFSTEGSRHARDIEQNEGIAVAIFSAEQPEYTPQASTVLNGVQFWANARKLSVDEYPDAVVSAIEALDPPMPPYEAFKIVPRRVYVPILEDGVNKRVEIDIEPW